MSLPWEEIDFLIGAALREDLGDAGDITSLSTVPADALGRGRFVAKADGVVAGIPIAERVFHRVDAGIACKFDVSDGEVVASGMDFGGVQGRYRSILTAERTVLNFLQHLSGIATLTARFVTAVEGTRARILDTRKTTPGYRVLEKYAVRMGGGENHRFGLHDMVLIKDNHIDAAGGLSKAVGACLEWRRREKRDVRIEVETRTLEEVREALQFPIQRIMLDNMGPETLRRAVEMIGGKAEVEASGNVRLETVRTIAETGVDFISVGSLTHSFVALDISLTLAGE